MKTYRQLRARLQRIRQRHQSARHQNRTAAVSRENRFEIFSESGRHYHVVATVQTAARRADRLAEQHPDEIIHVWSPDQQHVYEVTAIKQTAGFDTDESVAVELHDWIVNDPDLYRHLRHMQENMANKMAQGVYDSELAIKQFFWAANAGAKSYAREFGGMYHEIFPKAIRMMAAEMLRDDFEAEVEINPQDFAGRMPKKYLPRWEERYQPRGGSATQRTNRSHNKGNISMTQRPPSRRRRRRLANRVERARSRENNRDRYRSQERRGRRVESKEERLTRRVASLTRLLHKAERELRVAQRPPRRTARLSERELQARRERVAEIRERLERERRPSRRLASRRRRIRSRLHRRAAERPLRRTRRDRPERQPEPRRAAPKRAPERRPAAPQKKAEPQQRAPQERTAAPKVIRRQKDGKLYVRVD